MRGPIAVQIGTGILAVMLSGAAVSDDQRPDLTGIWTNASMTDLERPNEIDKLVVDEEEAAQIAKEMGVAGVDADERRSSEAGTDPSEGAPEAGAQDFGVRGYDAFWIDPGAQLARVKDGYRTSYITEPSDGQIPWKDGEQPRRSGRYVTGEGEHAGPEQLPLTERCIVSFGNKAGPGMLSALYNNNYQFVQTEDHFLIYTEMIHDARVVPIYDSKEEAQANHGPDSVKTWFGDSVGWYEDGALYVETINVRPEQMEEASVRISDNGRVIERFERYSENQIFYRFTVEDDTLYEQPWTAELAFYPTEGPIYEYACHEGNYSLPNILGGARAKEKEAEQ